MKGHQQGGGETAHFPYPIRFSLNTGSLDRPLAQIAQAARKAGFQGLEMWSKDLQAEGSSSVVATTLERNGLVVSAYQLLREFEGSPPDVRAARFDQAERMMAEMSKVGADTLLVCANTREDCTSDRRQIAADLRDLADIAHERGMRIAFEPLAWSRRLNRYEDAVEFVVAIDHPALGLAVDAFHWCWAHTPVELVRQIPVEKCFGIQLCDADPGALPAIEMARHHRLFPGEGIWPVHELLKEFLNLGYSGFVNLEIFNDTYRTYDPDEFAERAAQSVKKLMAAL